MHTHVCTYKHHNYVRARACDGEGQNLTHALECQATYHYNTSDISTVGTELLPKNLSPTPPGKRFLIDFTTKDELGHPDSSTRIYFTHQHRCPLATRTDTHT